MNLINIDLGLHTLRVELADHLAKGFFPAILRFTIVLGLIMAEENIEVSAGCSHERLQFGHALPHLFLGGGGGGGGGGFPTFWVGLVQIKLVWHACVAAMAVAFSEGMNKFTQKSVFFKNKA